MFAVDIFDHATKTFKRDSEHQMYDDAMLRANELETPWVYWIGEEGSDAKNPVSR